MTSKDQETKREQMRVSIKLLLTAWSHTCARNLSRSTEIRKVDLKSSRIYAKEVSRVGFIPRPSTPCEGALLPADEDSST